MKILYVGSERSDAQAIATALRGVDQAVSVSRVSHLEHAVKWLDENRDIAVLVVESRGDAASWPSVLAPMRDVGWHPPVVLIVADGTALPVEPHSIHHSYIHRNQSLLRDLPVVVTRAIDRAARVDLEEQLARATDALHDAEQRHRTAIATTDRQLAELHSQYEIGMARAAATWDMVDEQLRTAALEVERARQDRASAAADVDRLSRQLAEADAAIEAARARTEQERLAASERLAEQQRTLQAQVAHEVDRRRGVEDLLEEAVTALDDAEKRYASDMSGATAQSRELEAALRLARNDLESKAADVARLATREEEINASLAEVIGSRTDLERRLAATDAAFDEAVTRATRERLALSKKAAEREAELDGQLRQEGAARATLEQAIVERETELNAAQQQLSDTVAALEQARYDYRAAAADVERLTEREATLGEQIQQARATRATLEQAIVETEATLRDAQQWHDAALAAAATELAERQAHFDRELTQSAADCDRLAQQLTETDAALEQSRRDHRAAATDIERLTGREAALDKQIRQERAARNTLEQAVVDAEAALRDAQQRHDAASAAAAIERAERQAQFDRELTQTAADRDRLAQQLTESGAVLEQARRDQRAAATDIERLTKREADLTSRLTDVQAARKTLERQLAKATKAIREGAAREATLDAQLQQELGTSDALEQAIEDAEAALRDAQQQHDAALAAAATELAQRQTGFDHLLSEREADRDRLIQRLGDITGDLDDVCRAYESSTADIERLARRETDLTSQLADVQAARDTLEQAVADGEAALRDAQQRHDAALAAAATEFAEHQAHLDRELSLAADERDRLTEQVSDAAVTLERVRDEYQLAAADVERLTEQEAELRSQLADVHDARNTLEQLLVEARARAIAQEQQFDVRFAQEQLEHESRLADVQESNRTLTLERDALQQSLITTQEQSQQLRDTLAASTAELEVSSAESHRLFEQAGLPMFRCTRDGVLLDANRACTTLVGRRTVGELQGARFPAGVFDAPNALFWLIERCLSTRVKETVEATWRRNDGGRLFVRVSARLAGSDIIEFVVEDLTRLRILEERLSQAHRMEAVGRLASEVAVTCSTLLSDIDQNGREWLMTTGIAADSRERGERLLDEIRRAATLMQELAACGDEQQARTPMLVDLNTLIRDLEPVLKRVAGGDVDVQLQDDSSPLNVDVGTERVERLLVNLASYGRGRMPYGGQLRIELGKSVVDRRFAAKHPNVRLGLHALITVTEIRRATGTDGAPPPREKRSGVDFGTLQGLVSECGGHLWMSVQPPGEMVAKIRLPLSSPQDQTVSRTPVTRARRERLSARLFQA